MLSQFCKDGGWGPIPNKDLKLTEKLQDSLGDVAWKIQESATLRILQWFGHLERDRRHSAEEDAENGGACKETSWKTKENMERSNASRLEVMETEAGSELLSALEENHHVWPQEWETIYKQGKLHLFLLNPWNRGTGGCPETCVPVVQYTDLLTRSSPG